MSKQIVYLSDYEDEANLRRENFGKTNKYSTGFPGLDQYLGHGFGNKHGYEIVTVFGETGVGKSLFALNLVAHEMSMGTKIGLMALEDDMPDVYNRVRQIVGESGMLVLKQRKNVDVLPSSMLEKPWDFTDILRWIEGKHTERGIELFVVDHINFVFDNIEQVKGENEFARQRKFMQQLNFLSKRLRLTIILVAHVTKGENEGMAKVSGSKAVTEVSTKVVGVSIGEGAQLVIKMYKSRFTMRQDSVWQMQRTGLKLEEYPYGHQPLQPERVSGSSGRNRKKG